MHGFATGFAAGVLACLPGLVLAEMNAQNQRYICERGVQIPAVYVTSGDSSIVILTVEGNQILLYSEATASGVRYGWPSDGSHYVWLSKGEATMLFWHDGATNKETTLYAACTQT